MPRYPLASWIASAADLQALPADSGAEVAFVGRSNAGKSSAINGITGQRRLAYVSRTPGRTQTINFFRWGQNSRLVDLPGYGYAAVPAALAHEWQLLVSAYLSSRISLQGLVLVMDARHAFMPHDLCLLDWITQRQRPILALLTKSDKLSRPQMTQALKAAQAVLAARDAHVKVQPFSATSGLGTREARAILACWLGLSKKIPRLKGSKTGG